MRKLAVFIALGLLLTGCDESSSDNAQSNAEDSQVQLKPFSGEVDLEFKQSEPKKKINKPESCEAVLRFVIGKEKFQLDPHYYVGLRWQDTENENHSIREISGWNDKETCIEHDLEEIFSFSSPSSPTVSKLQNKNKYVSNYKKHEEKFNNNENLTTFNNGIKKLVDGFNDYYLLPVEITKDEVSEPVLIICDNKKTNPETTWFLQRCKTSFVHIDGNIVTADYSRRKYPEDKMIERFLKILSDYKEFKVKTK